jgi:type IV secretory pathway VirB9-like protein
MKTWIGLMTSIALTVGAPAFAQGTRDVSVTERGIVPVQTKLRFTTLIILPDGERILDFVCGDKDFWAISGVENLAYVKPAKAGASTNLNLVTASGRVYSFLLTEGAAEPDLKLYVTSDGLAERTHTAPRFYTSAEVEGARQEVERARQEAAAAQKGSAQAAEAAIAQFRASYPTQLRFPYRFRAHEKPFFVSAVYHDETFTYIRADATELPSLYELRDDLPNLVSFQVERGVYIVPKVIEQGYLAIGKQRFYFGQAQAR